MSVAESIVIFAPISQFGCASACSGVAAASASARRRRNGPPDAVSQILRTVRAALTGETLRDRDVLGVERQELRAARARLLEHERPAGDEHFLVRERDVACRARSAATTGSRPALPTSAPITRSAPCVATSSRPSRPRHHAQLRIAERLAHERRVLGARDRDELGAELLALLDQQIDGATGRERDHAQLAPESARSRRASGCRSSRSSRAARAASRRRLPAPATACGRSAARAAGRRTARRRDRDLVKSGQSTSLFHSSV